MTFKPHDKATVPALDTVIWRYVDLAKFVSMLDSRSLYFTSIAVLAEEDQWEGAFHRELRDMWRKETGREDLERSRQYLRERAFVSCWHMNEHESDAMWKLYSRGGNNVAAVCSTFGKLRDTLSSCAEPIHVGEVEYIDHATYDYRRKMVDASAGAVVLNITPVLLWKRPSYAHERELRAFYYTESPTRGPETRGIPMFVDLNLLFGEIRVSPRSERWFRELVEKILVKYGFANVPVKQSSMDEQLEP